MNSNNRPFGYSSRRNQAFEAIISKYWPSEPKIIAA